MKIQIPDWDNYKKALVILFRLGGTFRTEDPDVLILYTRNQYSALLAGGLRSGEDFVAFRSDQTRT